MKTNQEHPTKRLLKAAGLSHLRIGKYLGLSKSQTTLLLNGKAPLTPTRDRRLWELAKEPDRAKQKEGSPKPKKKGVKRCSKCEIPKPLSEFYFEYRSERIYRSECKSCTNRYQKEYKQRVRDKKYYEKKANSDKLSESIKSTY